MSTKLWQVELTLCVQYLHTLQTFLNEQSRDPCNETGFGSIEVTRGLTLGFQYYEGSSFLTGVHCHGNYASALTRSGAGYVQY